MSIQTPTQEEMEAPVKGYQLDAVNSKLKSIEKTLENIEKNTKGVVTQPAMESYVDRRIEEKTEDLRSFKTFTVKIAWTILSLIIVDIATRIFSTINGN